MINYVAGFLFNQNASQVVLIRKKKPTWQAGLLNAVGGKIEDGEVSMEAMRRESVEEMGVTPDWIPGVTLLRQGVYSVHFFTAYDEDAFVKAATMEEEGVERVPTHPLPNDTIPNLRWLIPMHLDRCIKLPHYILDIEGN